jgi:hypothetical protein
MPSPSRTPSDRSLSSIGSDMVGGQAQLSWRQLAVCVSGQAQDGASRDVDDVWLQKGGGVVGEGVGDCVCDK